MSYEIISKPILKTSEFPFEKMRAGTDDCFFVPFHKSGRGAYRIRRAATQRGFKIVVRERVHEEQRGYFVWVRKPSIATCGKVAVQQPDVVSVSTNL